MVRYKITLSIGLAALSLATAWVVSALKIPVYLDSFGIVASAILLGWRYAVLTALVIVVVGFFVVNPYLPAYVGTALLIATTSAFLYSNRFFDSLFKAVISGLVLAIVAAVASAPVTTWLFGGNTLSGVDAITAYLVATGNTLLSSVLITGFTSEPVDKVIVATVCYSAIKALPRRTIEKFNLRAIPKP